MPSGELLQQSKNEIAQVPSSQGWLSLFCLPFLEMLWSHEEEEAESLAQDWKDAQAWGRKAPGTPMPLV